MSEKTNAALDADFILNNRVFRGAFEKVRESYIQAIEDGDITDDIRRDKLMLGLQNLKAIKGCLEAHIADAELDAVIPEEF